MPSLAFCDSPKCENSEVVIMGKYKELKISSAPLLDMWSEASGNLVALEIKSTNRFNQLVLDYQDQSHKVLKSGQWTLVGNKLAKFDLINEIAKEKKGIKYLSFKLINEKNEFCHSDVEVIEHDADGVSDKIREKKK